jgi:hypothetical protein
MDIFLIIVGFLFMLLGIIGSFLPILPGPFTSWIGLLILHFTDAVPKNWTFLIVTLIIAILIWLIDYIIPAIGTKKFGGSRAGMFGAIVGLLVAIFFPILGFFGIIIWPFIGALVGELINRSDSNTAMKAAFGSLIGFITGTLLKFVVSVIYLGLFIMDVWANKSAIFTF